MKLDPRSFKGLSRFLAPSAGGPIADRAVHEKLITVEQLEAAVQDQDRSGRPLDEILLEKGFLTAAQVDSLRAPAVPAEVLPWLSDPDRHLGHYILSSLLGTGGMAEVWKAWDRSLGRWVAVKYLKREIGHPTQRIEREGRMAGQLSHPSVITIFERGEQNGRPYLVMPFVDGTPPQAPLPLRSAARLALDVARALVHVHEAGVIHRDVKPANILVEAGGRVVLTDFGLAILDETATSRWAMSGTPEYASPEQVRGDSLDLRTDIYSLGATLYHLVSGKPPYSGSDPDEITLKILREEPARLRGVPRDLAKVVRRAMARDREQRYPSALDLAKDLESWLEQSLPGRRRRSVWVVLAFVALMVSWGTTVLILLQSQRQEERERVLQSLRSADRNLLLAERRRSDPGSSRLDLEWPAREALAQYNLALRASDGKDADAQFGIGRCYELLGDDLHAEQAYKEAAAHTALAWLYARCLIEERPGRDWRAGILALPRVPVAVRQLAERKWEELLATPGRDQDSDLADLVWGFAAITERRWDDALQRLDASLRRRPNDSTALFYKGAALSEKGDRVGAKAAWTQALNAALPDWPLRPETARRVALSTP